MWKVLKGNNIDNSELDSTFNDLRKANNRAKTLRKSYRGKKINVFVVPADIDDPENYRKPIKGPWVNYDRPHQPKRIK